MGQVLCKGSILFKMPKGDRLLIPVMPKLEVVGTTIDKRRELNMDIKFCRIAYPQKCHTCKGGHHVHVEWN